LPNLDIAAMLNAAKERRWREGSLVRTIATTNYDTFLEAAYRDPRRRRQTLVPFVKDDEPVEDKMRSALNPVQYLKLHGCLNHLFDKDIPLVLSAIL
jgi:SIR2-like domain